MFRMIAKGITVDMFVGICDFEYKTKQEVIVNVIAYGKPDFNPTDISQCLDYSRVCGLVHKWADRPHVDLVETLLQEVIAFCFEDSRIELVDVEILKPAVIANTEHVGVGANLTREMFNKKSF